MRNKINHKHQNQVRIIGGEWRGRKITFPNVEGLRPTPDYVRERLFNWLGQDLTGWVVLDLFAGSGALGLEAASRYAKRVYLCDNNRLVVQNLQAQVRQLQVQERVNVCGEEGVAFLSQSSQTFDLILLDPPFVWRDWQALWRILPSKLASEEAYIYIEAGVLPDLPDGWVVVRQGKSGQSQQYLLQRKETE